jgi:hypothetical protein
MATPGRKSNLWHKQNHADNWSKGTNTKFRAGDVVRFNSNKNHIGVISALSFEREVYDVKIKSGKNAWDYYVTKVSANEMYKVEEQSPFKYDSGDRFPGPASNQIRQLNERMRVQAEKQKQIDVEQRIAALEEDMAYKKKIVTIKDDDSVEKIISADDEESQDTETEVKLVDPLIQKRENIIDEE